MNAQASVFAVTMTLSVQLLLTTAEHSGAYSSPQYAKKMYPKGYDTNALLPRETPPVLFKRHTETIDRLDSDQSFNDTAYGRSSFLESAGSLLSGSGGQFVSGLAKDFLARSTGSSQVGFDCISQVLSLNLTNLVILIVLKALVLAAGFFGAGAWKGHHYGRSLDDNMNATLISEDELLLYLSYLSGQRSRDYGCLYRLSCQRPAQADLYSSGAELLLQGAKLMHGNSVELEEYEEVSRGVGAAAAAGRAGGRCHQLYRCGGDSGPVDKRQGSRQ